MVQFKKCKKCARFHEKKGKCDCERNICSDPDVDLSQNKHVSSDPDATDKNQHKNVSADPDFVLKQHKHVSSNPDVEDESSNPDVEDESSNTDVVDPYQHKDVFSNVALIHNEDESSNTDVVDPYQHKDVSSDVALVHNENPINIASNSVCDECSSTFANKVYV